MLFITMDSTTSIHNIKNDDFDQIQMSSSCSISSIMDFTIDDETRLLFFKNMSADSNNDDDLIDVVSRIGIIFQMSGVKKLEFFLESVCKSTEIRSIFKIYAVKHLMSFSEREETVYPEDSDELKISKQECNLKIKCENERRLENALWTLETTCVFVCDDLTIPTPFKIEIFTMLIHHDAYLHKGIGFFNSLIKSDSLDCCFRYKIITSIAKYTTICESSRNLIQRTLLLSFINLDANKNMYTIIAAQNLLSPPHDELIDEQSLENVYSVLSKIASDSTNDHKIRADAADTLLSLCRNTDVVEIARNVIHNLSFDNISIHDQTVYSNLENVHVADIEKSALRNIETHLIKTPVMYKPGTCPLTEIDFDYLRSEITKYVSSTNSLDMNDIGCSLNRIELDKTLFGAYHMSLSNILIRAWSYVHAHEQRDELMSRLMDELRDMSGTCASGCAFRLANIISGFDDINLSISFHDQIIANFTARMNKRIRDLECVDSEIYTNGKCVDEIKSLFSCSEITAEIRETFQDKVVEELMYVNTKHLYELKNLTVVVRHIMLVVREELYVEFRTYVSDQEFDEATTVAFKKYL
jgi:hypothetical protein